MIACDTDMLELRFEGDDALAAYLNNAGHDEFGRPQPANNVDVQDVPFPLHESLRGPPAVPERVGQAFWVLRDGDDDLVAQFNASIPHNPLAIGQPRVRPKKAEVPCQRPVELHRFRWGDDNPLQPRVHSKKTEVPCQRPVD